MPLLLKPVDVADVVGDARSVLIVACPICPAFSLAMRDATPLFRFHKGAPRLIALQDHIEDLRHDIEARGVRTESLTFYAPLPMMCLWTEGQRNRLADRARTFEVALVLGCESAAYTVEQALQGSRCRVIQAMQLIGITNATVAYHTPMTLVLGHTKRVPVNAKAPGSAPETIHEDSKEAGHEQ